MLRAAEAAAFKTARSNAWHGGGDGRKRLLLAGGKYIYVDPFETKLWFKYSVKLGLHTAAFSIFFKYGLWYVIHPPQYPDTLLLSKFSSSPPPPRLTRFEPLHPANASKSFLQITETAGRRITLHSHISVGARQLGAS